MVSSRTATAIVGLVASVLISIAGWVVFDTLLFFLVVPFVPLLFRRRGVDADGTAKACPNCGFATTEPTYRHCPRDGTPLE